MMNWKEDELWDAVSRRDLAGVRGALRKVPRASCSTPPARVLPTTRPRHGVPSRCCPDLARAAVRAWRLAHTHGAPRAPAAARVRCVPTRLHACHVCAIGMRVRARLPHWRGRVDQGAKVDYKLEAKGGCKSVLHQAAFMGHLPVFQLLVSPACCRQAATHAQLARARANAHWRNRRAGPPSHTRAAQARLCGHARPCLRVADCALLLIKHVRGQVEEGAPSLQRDWSVSSPAAPGCPL